MRLGQGRIQDLEKGDFPQCYNECDGICYRNAFLSISTAFYFSTTLAGIELENYLEWMNPKEFLTPWFNKGKRFKFKDAYNVNGYTGYVERKGIFLFRDIE